MRNEYTYPTTQQKDTKKMNEPLHPMDMDLTVLIPDRDALEDIRQAHEAYDDPDEPLILSSIASLLMEVA